MIPMIIVAVTGILALILEMFRPKQNNDRIVVVSLGGLLLAGIMVFSSINGSSNRTAGGTILLDHFGAMMQLVVIVGTFLTILFSEGYLRAKRVPFGEFYPLVLWSAVGAMLMCASDHLLVIFLGLEILSIALYVMAGMSRSEEKSEESALKYFLLGAFASGFLLYGIAFIYGGTGSLSLDDATVAMMRMHGGVQVFPVLGLGLILIGISFKASLVPFHQWTPDVYQGAPTNVTSFMATASKVGAFAVLVRLLDSFSTFESIWLPALSVLAALTMTVGNLIALKQKDVKRILGYSSIAQAGYVLVAVLAHSKNPLGVWSGTIPYYLLGYTAMTTGAFAVISLNAKDGKEGTGLEELHGLWKRSPFAALALVCFMSSLIGLPPFVGFFGKLWIFTDALKSGMTWLAVVLAINSVISVYYYLGIARAALTSDDVEEPKRLRLDNLVVGACALSLIGIVVAVLPPVMNMFTGK